MGIITESAAVRALRVSSPKEGGQSRMIKAYWSRTWLSSPSNFCSRAIMLTISTSAPGQVDVRGDQGQEGYLGLIGDFGGFLLSDQRVVDIGRFDFRAVLKAAARSGVGLRVHVDEQGLLLGHGEAGRQVDGGGSLADSSFLIGYGDDPTHGSSSLGKGGLGGRQAGDGYSVGGTGHVIETHFVAKAH